MLDTMLALTPLSGLHAAIKRRNSRARRDSISLGQSSSLTLPGNMRRFSSSESIAHKDGASVTRRSSFTRRIRRVSTATNQAEASENCAALDLHIERIKRKLVSSPLHSSQHVDITTITYILGRIPGRRRRNIRESRTVDHFSNQSVSRLPHSCRDHLEHSLLAALSQGLLITTDTREQQ